MKINNNLIKMLKKSYLPAISVSIFLLTVLFANMKKHSLAMAVESQKEQMLQCVTKEDAKSKFISVHINENFVGNVENQEVLNEFLLKLTKKYTDGLTPESVEILEKIEVKDEELNTAEIMDENTFFKIIENNGNPLITVKFVVIEDENEKNLCDFHKSIGNLKKQKITVPKFKVTYLNGKETARELFVGNIGVTSENATKDNCEKIKFTWPVPYTKKITSGFGFRGDGFHKGIDIACAGVKGHSIVAAWDGTVEKVSNGDGSYGKFVKIRHDNGLTTLYAHCDKIVVKENKKVTAGTVIAKVGETGSMCDGPHLHFEIIKDEKNLNPEEFLIG